MTFVFFKNLDGKPGWSRLIQPDAMTFYCRDLCGNREGSSIEKTSFLNRFTYLDRNNHRQDFKQDNFLGKALSPKNWIPVSATASPLERIELLEDNLIPRRIYFSTFKLTLFGDFDGKSKTTCF